MRRNEYLWSKGLIYPHKKNVFRGILESACLSVRVYVHLSISVQNTSFCQSNDGGIKSHLVTALVSLFFFLLFFKLPFDFILPFHLRCG